MMPPEARAPYYPHAISEGQKRHLFCIQAVKDMISALKPELSMH